jgi:ribosomal protein S27E
MNTYLTKESRPNFIDEDGNPYLVKCPECKKENYSLAVSSGQCSFCGFSFHHPHTSGNTKTGLPKK